MISHTKQFSRQRGGAQNPPVFRSAGLASAVRPRFGYRRFIIPAASYFPVTCSLASPMLYGSVLKVPDAPWIRYM